MSDIQVQDAPITARPYQREALDAIDARLREGKTRIVVVLPTGTGKGWLAAQLPSRLGTPLLLLTHREELLDQHAAHMQRCNPSLRIGIEQAQRTATGTEDVIVASIPTLAAVASRRLARFTAIPWSAIIVDEVHHAAAQTWRHILEQLGCFTNSAKPLIGFTATPCRGDGVGLHTIFEEIAYQRALREMIDERWCADIRAYAIQTDVDLDQVHVRHGDFVEGELAGTVNTPGRNTVLVEAWRRLGEGRRTLVFCANVLHAEAVALSFRKAGITAEPLTHTLPKDLRRDRLAAFRAGDTPVLTSVGIVSEGYDDPPLSCLLLARPTKSPLLFQQQIGRGTRTHPDKRDLLVLDVVDVSRRHRIQTVASLFGLPPSLDLKGRSATKTADEVEAAMSRHPQLQPELFATAEQLLAEAERLTLDIRRVDLVPTLAPEVAAEAALAWIRLPSGQYVLPLAGKSQIRVRSNLLDQWEVVLLPEQAVLHTHRSRSTAFGFAENELASRDLNRWRLAHHQAPWRRQPPSDSQLGILQAARLPIPSTKGEASQLIDQLRVKRQEPATSRQRWFLKQHHAWQEGMTRGEAGLLIKRIKQREAALASTPNTAADETTEALTDRTSTTTRRTP